MAGLNLPIPDETGDETIDITPEKTARGNWRAVDMVLAEIAKSLMLHREAEREIKRAIKTLEARQRKRINALQKGGPLGEYPTGSQRKFITMFEMAMQFPNSVVLTQAYEICVEQEVHRTNYKFGGDEPIMAAYARRMVELRDAEDEEARKAREAVAPSGAGVQPVRRRVAAKGH